MIPERYLAVAWQLVILVALTIPLVVPPGLSTLGVAYVIWGFVAVIVENAVSTAVGTSGYRPTSDFARRNAR